MIKVEAFQTDDGSLEKDLRRAKARDLAYAIETAVRAGRGGPMPTPPKIDWHVAMEMLEHVDIVIQHLGEYLLEKDGSLLEVTPAKTAKADMPVSATGFNKTHVVNAFTDYLDSGRGNIADKAKNVQNILNYFRASKVEELPVKNFDEALSHLKTYRMGRFPGFDERGRPKSLDVDDSDFDLS